MATLYVDQSPLSATVKIVASYLGLNDVSTQDSNSEEAKKLNPLGLIPTMKTAGGQVFFGAATISKYLVSLSKDAEKVKNLTGSTPIDQALIGQWISMCETDLAIKTTKKDRLSILHVLNHTITPFTFFVGNVLSLADLFLYASLHPTMAELTDEEKINLCSLSRWFDFIQNQKGVANVLAPVAFQKDINAPLKPLKKPEAPQKKKPEDATKAEAAAEGQKKEGAPAAAEKKGAEKKKEAAPKAAKKEAAPATPLDISHVDIRVGKILKAWKHPDADSLYVEEIDVGEEKPRQVVSGLVKYVPLEQMQDRVVLLMCNLEESKMRGITSQAMVLAASDAEKTQVELVTVPAGAKIGERVTFEGYPQRPIEELQKTKLNKKTLGSILPDLHTDSNGTPNYKGVPFTTSAGICTATIKDGNVG